MFQIFEVCAFTALTVRKHGSAGKNSIAAGNFYGLMFTHTEE